MASVTQNFMKLFRGSSGEAEAAAPHAAQKLTRRSSGLGELARMWDVDSPLCVLDLGSTSPSNIRFFTERSHKIYSEDLLVASTDPSLVTKDEQGNVVLDSRQFLADNLVYPAAHFDVVFCWNLADYLDESLVRPVMGRLWSVLKPGGVLLAFFHTRTQGEETAHRRYHVTAGDDVEMQLAQQFPIQRCFTNRSIERLFAGWSGHRQFLAKDSVSEVIMTR